MYPYQFTYDEDENATRYFAPALSRRSTIQPVQHAKTHWSCTGRGLSTVGN